MLSNNDKQFENNDKSYMDRIIWIEFKPVYLVQFLCSLLYLKITANVLFFDFIHSWYKNNNIWLKIWITLIQKLFENINNSSLTLWYTLKFSIYEKLNFMILIMKRLQSIHIILILKLSHRIFHFFFILLNNIYIIISIRVYVYYYLCLDYLHLFYDSSIIFIFFHLNNLKVTRNK